MPLRDLTLLEPTKALLRDVASDALAPFARLVPALTLGRMGLDLELALLCHPKLEPVFAALVRTASKQRDDRRLDGALREAARRRPGDQAANDNDPAALREALILSARPVVTKLARELARRGLEADDLVGEGMLLATVSLSPKVPRGEARRVTRRVHDAGLRGLQVPAREPAPEPRRGAAGVRALRARGGARPRGGPARGARRRVWGARCSRLRDALRRRARRGPGGPPAPGRAAAAGEAMGTLAAQERAVIEAHVLAGVPLEALARELGLGERTAKRRSHDALVRLRAAMAPG